MILNQQDAEWAMLYFTNYFAQFDRIDQYIKEQKLEQVKDFPFQLPGMADEDDFFNDFGILPENMNFDIQEMDNDTFTRILNKVTSHTAMASIPGKAIRIIVKETNTNKIVGFIRFGSPMMNSKPRNEVLGRPLKTQDKVEMKRFNHAAIMGFTIVPTQPFGYNYLGGKLLAAICCSHRIKKLIDDKYNTNICLFETTSLYGSSKSSSQYDGMKPYLRFKGVTESNFIPMLHGESFAKINDWFKEKNGGPIVKDGISSRKLTTHHAMINIIQSSLKKHNEHLYNKFVKFLEDKKSLTEKKRFYVSDYGYENVPDYIKGKTDELKPGFHYDKFSFENVIKWWQKIATKRYNKLVANEMVRNDLEIWTEGADIQIIR